MRFPKWWQAPQELLKINGHCGLIAGWAALHYFGINVSAPRFTKACRYTKGNGIFTVDLAFALKEHGLRVSFHSDIDDEIGRFEKIGYNRARRAGILPEPALELSQVLRERRRGHIPIVLFNQSGPDSGHFSPLLGRRGDLIRLPYCRSGTMTTEEFLTAWTGNGILRQCVIVKRPD